MSQYVKVYFQSNGDTNHGTVFSLKDAKGLLGTLSRCWGGKRKDAKPQSGYSGRLVTTLWIPSFISWATKFINRPKCMFVDLI